MKILIAEDEVMARNLLDFTLRKHSYETLLAVDGQEALDLLHTHSDIGLVIADIIMPKLDGIELLTEMRADLATRDIPVIVATVMAEMDTVRIVAKLGCTRYLVKPVSPDDLLTAVREALGESARVREALGQQEPVPVPTRQGDLPASRGYDLDDLLADEAGLAA